MALLIKKDTCLIILRTKHQVAPQPSLSNANHKDKGKAWAFGLEKEKNKNHFWGKYSPTFNFANYVTHKWFYRASIFHFWNVLFVRYKSSVHSFFISFNYILPTEVFNLLQISILQEHITFWGMPDFQSLHIWMHEDYTGWNHCIPHKKVVDNIAHI